MRFAVKALLATLALCLMLSPALAGPKKKTAKDSFTAQALPFPNYSSHVFTEAPSCFAGQEDVNWVAHGFHVPGTGSFTASMTGFTGDWDLMVTDENGEELGSSFNEQIGQGGVADAEEIIKLKLKKNTHVYVIACNWLGAPEATVDIVHVYKK